jgi:RNA polymerase sigma factor (sigma-70 family)
VIGEAFVGVLAGAREGQPWALEVVYRDLAPSVLGYLRGLRAREPEDLASEVFVGVARGLASFEGEERAFRSWVFAIAHRRVLDERRRLARRREDPVEPSLLAGLPSGSAVGDVEEEALGRLGGARALRLLEGLTEDQRAVLLLRILADLSVEEVAQILGKRPGAVKTLQRRALAALARHLQKEGVS